MVIKSIPAGKIPPADINVVIEIPMNGDPIKYELDKDTGALFVDRFFSVSMHYPCNYGFIPGTLGGDKDPLDVLLVSNFAVLPGAVVNARPIGVLIMEDESGQDEKIIAVPVTKVDPSFADVKSIKNLSQAFRDKIVHFFERYKDLESGKWVKIIGWGTRHKADKLITQAISNFKANC